MADQNYNRNYNSGGGAGPQGGQPSLLNPDRPQALNARANAFITSGTLTGIRFVYLDGSIQVEGAILNPNVVVGQDPNLWMPYSRALRAASNQGARPQASPDVMDGRKAIARFERRFGLEAPNPLLTRSMNESEVEAAFAAMPFNYRRVFYLSNKVFEREFPNGFHDGFPIGVADAVADGFREDLRESYSNYFLLNQDEIPVEIQTAPEIMAIPTTPTAGEMEEARNRVFFTPMRPASRARLARVLFPPPRIE